MAKQELIKEAFKLQQLAGIKSLYEFESDHMKEAMDDDDVADSWDKPEDDGEDYEKEPSMKDIKTVEKKAGGKQAKLARLIQQKDAILAKFKSGEISIGEYKEEIGNIPQQIKNLQADIEKSMGMGGSEEEMGDEEALYESRLRGAIRLEVKKILRENRLDELSPELKQRAADKMGDQALALRNSTDDVLKFKRRSAQYTTASQHVDPTVKAAGDKLAMQLGNGYKCKVTKESTDNRALITFDGPSGMIEILVTPTGYHFRAGSHPEDVEKIARPLERFIAQVRKAEIVTKGSNEL
jgi:hypothetical protein